jgi:hypothetical protein
MFATTPAASTFATPAKGEPALPARGERAETAVADGLKQCDTKKKQSPTFRKLLDSIFFNGETQGSHFHT